MKKKKTNDLFVSKEIKKDKYMNDDMKKVIAFIIVLIVVIGCIALLFFLNGKYVTKDEFQESTTTTTTEVSYDDSKILISDMFNKGKKEYMVLLYDSNDETSNFLYSGLVNSYKGDTTLYSVDLANKMNASYYDKTKDENTNPKKLNDVNVTRPTLITFKNGKVTSYITDSSSIVDKLS